MCTTHCGDTACHALQGHGGTCQHHKAVAAKGQVGSLCGMWGCSPSALQEHGASQGCKDVEHCLHCRRSTPPALQGCSALPQQAQHSTALPELPALRCKGTTHPALQGCRSPAQHLHCTACHLPLVPVEEGTVPGIVPGEHFPPCTAAPSTHPAAPEPPYSSSWPLNTTGSTASPLRCTVSRQPRTLHQPKSIPCSFPFSPALG